MDFSTQIKLYNPLKSAFFAYHFLNCEPNCLFAAFAATFNFSGLHYRMVDSVVSMRSTSTWLHFKTYSLHSVVFLGKIVYGTFLYLSVSTNTSKIQSYLNKNTEKPNKKFCFLFFLSGSRPRECLDSWPKYSISTLSCELRRKI